MCSYSRVACKLRRGHGMLTLTREIRRAFRAPDPCLVVAFIDMDGLKWFNDHAGHAEGDKLLIAVTQSMTKRLRSHDVTFRYGGDEFVCVLPGAKLSLAEPIFDSIQHTFGESSRGRAFTVGLAELRPADTPVGLVARADEALYATRAPRARRPLSVAAGFCLVGQSRTNRQGLSFHVPE